MEWAGWSRRIGGVGGVEQIVLKPFKPQHEAKTKSCILRAHCTVVFQFYSLFLFLSNDCFSLIFFRELLTRISEEDEKIQVVSRELSSEHEQVEKEKAIVEKKEEDLQEQVVRERQPCDCLHPILDMICIIHLLFFVSQLFQSSLNKFQLSYDASLEVHNKGKER